MDNETAAAKECEQIFSDEMLAKIAESEKEIERDPDCWVDAFEALEELRKKYEL